MAVTLRRPDPAEYEEWSRRALEGYIDDIAASGAMTRALAEEKGRSDHARALPDGLNTPGQLIFRVEVDGQPAGWLWLALQDPRAEAGVGFIYSVEIDEAFRGLGHGRAAMELAESEARRNGLHALSLNVFGQNAIARGLYGRLGYRETAVQMRKDLRNEP